MIQVLYKTIPLFCYAKSGKHLFLKHSIIYHDDRLDFTAVSQFIFAFSHVIKAR